MKGTNQLPSDPFMLLSYVNTALRDHYESLDDFCASLNVCREELEKKLKETDYEYDETLNKFV